MPTTTQTRPARTTKSCKLPIYVLRINDEPAFRCTKGIGRTQPVQWKDAGETLSNPALKGCYMPEGPGQVSHANASLQYNEASLFLDAI